MYRSLRSSIHAVFSIFLLLIVLPLSLVGAAEGNSYRFEPETLSVAQGQTFEWHLMLESKGELCGYGFAIDALLGDSEVLSPDTLLFDWTDAASDAGKFEIQVGPEFDPVEGWFGGGTTSVVCPPGVPAGTHLAVRIFGTVSEDAVCGVYEFRGPHEGKSCDLTGSDEKTLQIPLASGYLNVVLKTDEEKMEEKTEEQLEE